MKIAIMESLGISTEELAARKKPFEEQGHIFSEFTRTTDIEELKKEAAEIVFDNLTAWMAGEQKNAVL